jgi:hypothetical protein
VGDGDLVDVKWEELLRTAKNKNKKRTKKKSLAPSVPRDALPAQHWQY